MVSESALVTARVYLDRIEHQALRSREVHRELGLNTDPWDRVLSDARGAQRLLLEQALPPSGG